MTPISPKKLVFGRRTYIMGIINVTPDSFSGDGLMQQSDLVESAVTQARNFITAGADILDIGGESTRPGAAMVSEAEEIDRVIPVVERLVAEKLNVTLSIDTYKAKVAQYALAAGAHWINDVWALKADPDMAKIVSEYNAEIILMHNRSKPSNIELQTHLGEKYTAPIYKNLLKEIQMDLLDSIEIAKYANIPDQKIILDPGIGFGKTVEQNLEIINRLDDIKALGYPVLLGPSRKSFIGYTLNLPKEQRLEGTLAAVVVGILRGADIVRIHDVEACARAVKMTDAILGRIMPQVN